MLYRLKLCGCALKARNGGRSAAWRFVLAGVALVAGWVHADASVECARIENARERLACFDELFPRQGDSVQRPRIRTEEIRVPETLGQPARADGADTGDGRVTEQPVPGVPSAAAEDPPSAGGMFDRDAEVDLTTTIKAVRTRDQQKMVFLLANDQMWMQDSPRQLPIKAGDEVTIRNARVGGYILRTASGTATRVRRIK